ncbi:MAG: sarcosine oxidase subunit gamma family protein [Pseudomonadota bacterium]
MNESVMQPSSPFAPFLSRTQGRFSDDEAGVVFREQPFVSHINLRGNPDDKGFIKDTVNVLGFDLPLSPNIWSGHEGVRVCWLGPNEWLVITTGAASEWIDAVRAANESRLVAVTDVSGGQTIVQLSGTYVRDLFAKGCTLDFHPRAFTTGQCAQSSLGKAPALFIQTDDAPVFDLVVRRSFSDYIAYWIEDAAHEFGLRIVRD